MHLCKTPNSRRTCLNCTIHVLSMKFIEDNGSLFALSLHSKKYNHQTIKQSILIDSDNGILYFELLNVWTLFITQYFE